MKCSPFIKNLLSAVFLGTDWFLALLPKESALLRKYNHARQRTIICFKQTLTDNCKTGLICICWIFVSIQTSAKSFLVGEKRTWNISTQRRETLLNDECNDEKDVFINVTTLCYAVPARIVLILLCSTSKSRGGVGVGSSVSSVPCGDNGDSGLRQGKESSSTPFGVGWGYHQVREGETVCCGRKGESETKCF